MRAAIPILLLVPLLAGCIKVGDVDEPDFERSCPAYFPAKGTSSLDAKPGYYYNASSTDESARQLTDRSKWLVKPNDAGGHRYVLLQKNEDGEFEEVDSPNTGSQTDFYEITLHIVLISDTKVRFQAYRSQDEQVTQPGEEVSPPTGDRLLFRDFSKPKDGQYSSELVLEAPGERPADQIRDVTMTLRIELSNGHGAVHPSDLRIDAFYEGDQDGDPQTDSFAVFEMQAERWYRHVDCIP